MQFYNDFSDAGKRYFRVAMAVLAVGAILAVFALAASYILNARTAARSVSQTQISVTGEGKVSARPDIAVLNATIMTENATVSEAQAQNTRSSDAVMKFLKEQGVEDKDVKTTNYSIYPQYFYPQYAKPSITGYQVRNMLEIKIRDLSKVDKILGGVVTNGANEIGNVAFTIENPDKLKEEARQKAIENAKAKAKVLAKDLGVRISKIVGFSESSNGGVPPIFYAEAAYGKGGGGGPDLAQGEQEIKIFVTVTYEFKSR